MNEVPAKGRLPRGSPEYGLNETDLTPEQQDFAELLGRLLASGWQGRGLNPIAPDAQLRPHDDVSTEFH